MSNWEKSGPGPVSKFVDQRWVFYALWVAGSLVLFVRPLISVIHFAARNGDASHIFLIPFISIALIYLDRRAIFQEISCDFAVPAILGALAAGVGAAAFWRGAGWSASKSVAAYMLAVVLVWVAGFVLFFGRSAARAARFALLLLLLAVPLPDFLLSHVVYFLQRGSAEMVAALFDLTRIPYLRDGFIFQLSSVSIEIAEECSGIRSSVAVLILALLAAHFYLRSFWRQALFILCSLLIMIVKNGIRIATLTILSVYVNPSFLFGRLHHQGGVVFFLVGLALLAPILWLLRSNSRKALEGSCASESNEV